MTELDVAANRPVALVVLTGGGFTFETRCLLERVGPGVDYIYLRTRFGGDPGTNGIPPGPAYPIPAFASKTRGSALNSAAAFAQTFVITLRVLRRHRIAAVICAGGSHAVPMCLAGRLLGRQTVYFESVTRADQLSLSGRLVYGLRLASTFLVQWPELALRHKRARLGTIL